LLPNKEHHWKLTMSKNLKKPASLAILISCARSSFKDHKPHHHREAIRNI
jgi:hypothetical protein